MGILMDLKNEIEAIESDKELNTNAKIVIDIAEQVDKLNSKLPHELIFQAIVQAIFGKMVW
ncbi:MAG TPA: hypothetical protein VLX61_01510 [Anaerolineales bacterium]|nr:hypothetical protein [Anaerolineales bacterium]